MTAYPPMLAGGVTLEGTFSPYELFAGESRIVTGQGTASATALPQFQVCARDGTFNLVPWDGVTVAGPGKPFCITAQPIPANSQGPVFLGGVFNYLALVWGAGDALSLAAKKAAFDGTNIVIGKILGVGGNITYAPIP